MRKLILTFILLGTCMLYAQKNELGVHFGFGGFSSVQMNDGTPVTKPSFFPTPDSLTKMTYIQSGTVANFPIGINYTRWRPTMKENFDQGISGSFGFGGRVVNREEWSVIDTITFDTITVQSSGAKFPIDSFITDIYRMQTMADAMRFTIGYHYRVNWDRVDLVLGADFVFQHYGEKRREYRYYQRGTTNLPESFQPDSIPEPNFAEPMSGSQKFRMKSISYGFQFPLEVRFHRQDGKAPRRGIWRPELMGTVAIQVVPAVYYLKFNGIDKYYGSCSLGFNWVYKF